MMMIYTGNLKSVIWKSKTWQGDHSCFLAAQTDGQLVFYRNNNGTIVKIQSLNGSPAVQANSYTLSLQDDGNLVYKTDTGKIVWSSIPVKPLYTYTQPSVYFLTVMQSGTTLNSDCNNGSGCFLASPTQEFKLVMQHDCKLMLYMNDPTFQSVFGTNTWLGDGHKCFMAAQSNGQLVVYRNDGASPVAMWTSNPVPTTISSGYTLTLQENGKLIWADSNNTTLWSTDFQVQPLVNNYTQPAGCPSTPFVTDARVDCKGTDYQSCFSKGCCWDPPPKGQKGIPCYTTTKNKWFGTPGSDQPVEYHVTAKNPGRYDVATTLPVAPLGLSPMPNTNNAVILERISWGYYSTYHSYTMDMATFQLKPLYAYSDIFCSGGVLLPDGTLLNIGGWVGDPSLKGVRYLPVNGDWKQNAKVMALEKARWYPSAVLLPSGKVWAVGGAPSSLNGVNEPTVEILPNPGKLPIVNVPFLAQTIGHNFYPFVYYIPADEFQPKPFVWLFAGYQSRLYDPDTFVAFASGANVPSQSGKKEYRSYPFSGTSAMLPVAADANNNVPPVSILICGGSDGVNALDTCITTTPSQAENATWLVEKMPIPRVLGDLVSLPDQTLLLINGATMGQAGFGMQSKAALNPVLYNPHAPLNQRFTVLQKSPIQRLYHSEAMLALDGRVIVSGSTPNQDSNDDPTTTIHENERRLEMFTPPYLLDGRTPPQILSAETQWEYNTTYSLTVSIPSGNTNNLSVSLINPGFITHNNHMGNSHYVLNIVSVVADGTSYTLDVQSPKSSEIAIPLYYQLWVVDDGKPCKMAKWIQLKADTIEWPQL
ncbi:hypothetical protein HK103_007528 [Boothiomyces macroporosus]|uniref:Galactose oxidase n=1 Tax=Boothiomyces macroporosus TaxID=261099 RepID=A0AAD5Y1Q9_9FUNG|nr:hypothetical protein HK103_007528 [Boothiomyces macroporosus]